MLPGPQGLEATSLSPAVSDAITAEIAAAVVGLFDFKGSTDTSGNPNYPSALKGDAYMVTVAGKIGGASGTVVSVGDIYFAIADNAGGTQAAVGASWDVLEANISGITAAGLAMIQAANAAAQRALLYTAPTVTLLVTGTAATFTPQATTKRMKVTIVGGGGGGGGVDGQGAGTGGAAGGGGAAGIATQWYTITGSQTWTYTVGALGAGGAAGANNGTAGGNSTWTDGTTTVTAPGGNGGIAKLAAAGFQTALGGVMSTAPTNGKKNSAGDAGGLGQILSATGIQGCAGYGASAPGFGSGGDVRIAEGAGGAAQGNGSGGGGALVLTASTTNYAGGDGTVGCILVEEYAI